MKTERFGCTMDPGSKDVKGHTPHKLPFQHLAGTIQMLMQDNVFSGSEWKTLFFSLQGDKLFYFKSKQHLEHIGFLVLRRIKSITLKDEFRILIETQEPSNPSKLTWLKFFSLEQMHAWHERLQIVTKFFRDDYQEVHNHKKDSDSDELAKTGDLKSSSSEHQRAPASPKLVHSSPIKNSPTPIDLRQSTPFIQRPATPKPNETDSQPDHNHNFSSLSSDEKDQKIHLLLQQLQQQEKTIQQMKQTTQTEETARFQKQLDELQFKYETQNEKLVEIQEDNDEKTKVVRQLETQVKELQLKLLDKTEMELSEKSRAFMSRPQNDPDTKLQSQLLKLQEKYFFSLAMNIKMMGSAPQLDVNALYQQALSLGIGVDAWDSWILAHANDTSVRF